ncbi:Hypothetical protein AL25TRB_057 [Escherichia phage vB_Eco_AL25]|uniref:ATPase AAA-type core domain-containing protein n=1 Tax=Escherichia phage PMBT57 TaxID=2079259 RepID=A0A2K9VA67_9CAUD|nr:hypothetical protein [Escherichia phage PMBT57]CAE6410816.1 gp24 [Escherichia phage vB_Eco_Jura]CAH0462267.1 hypothetical protein [Escherichia phage PMBT57] [Escherichia phage vB_Eco_SPSP]CAH6421915.1 Hypothetical protein AL25TRB_057 [Escherichia phage vB_Eco_AL25]
MASIDSIAVCNPRQVRKFVEHCIRSGLVPFITSSPGMGKSAIVHQIAEDFGLKLIDHRLSTSAPEDLSGLPRFKENGRAEFAPFDELFPLEGDTVPEGFNGWLLFLDEFNSARKEIQAAAYKLVLDRMTGQKKLHPYVAIVCAGNKATDRAITNNLSTAMQSRLIHLEMETDFDVFMEDVAIPNKWDERVIAFLNANPNKLNDFEPDHQEKTFCCSRTWEFVNKIVSILPPGPIDSEMTLLLAGTITSGVATSFVQFTQVYSNMVSLNEILDNPKKARMPEDNNLLWAVVTSLINNTDEDNHSKIFDYVERMPFTFKVLYYRSVGSLVPALVKLPNWRVAAITLSKYVHGSN